MSSILQGVASQQHLVLLFEHTQGVAKQHLWFLSGTQGVARFASNTLVELCSTQGVLMPISFGSIFCLMLLYWGQAALFSYTKYSKLTTLLFSFSFISLTTLLILRWVDSGHFPLSNLYESLLFLSWSFLGIQLVAQLTLISAVSEPALLRLAFSGVSKTKTGRIWRDPLKFSTVNTLGRTKFDQSVVARGASNTLGLAKPNQKTIKPATQFALREVSQRQLLHLLGVITSPMALLTYGFAFLNLPREMQKATALVPALQSNWLMMHVTIMILSYAALLCGSIFSMAFLLLTSLKRSSPNSTAPNQPEVGKAGSARVAAAVPALPTSGWLGAVSKLHLDQEPPYLSLAERLDNYSYRVLALGFPLLTVGILSGAVWANEAWGSYWSWDPKETWALITWLVFAIYLHSRILKGWTGRKPAIIATFGFFVVWFCYLGVNLLGTGLHSYGWFSN